MPEWELPNGIGYSPDAEQRVYRPPPIAPEPFVSPRVTARAVTVDGTVVEQAHAALEHAKTSYEKFLNGIPREHYSAEGMREHIARFANTHAAKAVDKSVEQVRERADRAATQVAKVRKQLSPDGDVAAELRARNGKTQASAKRAHEQENTVPPRAPQYCAHHDCLEHRVPPTRFCGDHRRDRLEPEPAHRIIQPHRHTRMETDPRNGPTSRRPAVHDSRIKMHSHGDRCRPHHRRTPRRHRRTIELAEYVPRLSCQPHRRTSKGRTWLGRNRPTPDMPVPGVTPCPVLGLGALLLRAEDPFLQRSVAVALDFGGFAVAEGDHIGLGCGFPAGGDLGEDDHDIIVGNETAGCCCEGLLGHLREKFRDLGFATIGSADRAGTGYDKLDVVVENCPGPLRDRPRRTQHTRSWLS